MFKLGDVLYRPCLGYAGYKNFINTSVVRSVVNREDGDYIVSYDAFRQSWTDNVHDVGVTVFTDRAEAEKALAKMIAAKEKRTAIVSNHA